MTFALVTPSFAPDFERCRLLVESAACCLPADIPHYLVVDRRDLDLFRGLASARTRLLAVEEVLPDWIYREPGRTDSWASRRTPPIFNWVVQQLVKLSIFSAIPEDVAIFCDSDNAFIRPFDPRLRLVKDHRLALLRFAESWPDLEHWRKVAAQLLGLPGMELPAVNYIGNLIAWRRENVLALHRRMEAVAGTGWLQAVAGHPYLSEYVLYGVMVEQVLGLEQAGHLIHNEPLIHASWNLALTNEAELDRFWAGLRSSHVGIMIHSKDAVPVARYRDQVLARARAEAGLARGPSPV